MEKKVKHTPEGVHYVEDVDANNNPVWRKPDLDRDFIYEAPPKEPRKPLRWYVLNDTNPRTEISNNIGYNDPSTAIVPFPANLKHEVGIPYINPYLRNKFGLIPTTDVKEGGIALSVGSGINPEIMTSRGNTETNYSINAEGGQKIFTTLGQRESTAQSYNHPYGYLEAAIRKQIGDPETTASLVGKAYYEKGDKPSYMIGGKGNFQNVIEKGKFGADINLELGYNVGLKNPYMNVGVTIPLTDRALRREKRIKWSIID